MPHDHSGLLMVVVVEGFLSEQQQDERAASLMLSASWKQVVPQVNACKHLVSVETADSALDPLQHP